MPFLPAGKNARLALIAVVVPNLMATRSPFPVWLSPLMMVTTFLVWPGVGVVVTDLALRAMRWKQKQREPTPSAGTTDNG